MSNISVLFVVFVFSAEVGGLLGLCLGASMLTVAEIFEMLILCIAHLFKREIPAQHKVQDIKVKELPGKY